MTVTASISTKDRYWTTLPLALAAIAAQTVKPKQLVIFDDGEFKDLRNISPYCHLFPLLMSRGIQWFHLPGQRRGQVANHQTTLDQADSEFVWRCFPGSQVVEVIGGLRKISEIKVGDLVKTNLGRFKPVIRVHKNRYPQRSPISIVKTPHSEIRCTPEHPFMVGVKKFVSAKDLRYGERLLYPSRDRRDYLSIDCVGRRTHLGNVCRDGKKINIRKIEIDQKMARFFGLYAAEGCGGHDSIRFTFGNHEKNLYDFVQEVCIERFKRIPSVHKRWATTVKLNIRSLSKQFTEWFGKDALVKKVPDFVFKWSIQNKLAFIFGYLDGDGWEHGKVGFRFGTSSNHLYFGISKLLNSCGLSCKGPYKVKASVSTYKGVLIKSKGSFQGTIHKTSIQKMLDIIGAERVNRSYLGIPVHSVRSSKMSRLSDQHVYNLEVKDDNTYIAGPCAVHNCDDDNAPEPTCLERLLKRIDGVPEVGAVGGLIHDPRSVSPRPGFITGKIEEILNPFNLAWYQWSGPAEEVDHLYSTFLYRVEAAKKAGGYHKGLSPVGHREETMFSHEIKRAGYKLLIAPDALTWHFREGKGGIRSYTDGSLWDKDEKIFRAKLSEWGVVPRECKMVVLNCGLGDHFMFLSILPELIEKNKGKKIVIANCYPEVFKDVEGVEMASIADAIAAFQNLDQWDIYRWCEEKNWKKPFPDAFREMYL